MSLIYSDSDTDGENYKRIREMMDEMDKYSNLDRRKSNCLLESFFEDNPRKNVAHISCPCPKCTPRC